MTPACNLSAYDIAFIAWLTMLVVFCICICWPLPTAPTTDTPRPPDVLAAAYTVSCLALYYPNYDTPHPPDVLAADFCTLLQHGTFKLYSCLFFQRETCLLRNSSVETSAAWYGRRGLFEPRVKPR